jgi:uncharacterized membrane protein
MTENKKNILLVSGIKLVVSGIMLVVLSYIFLPCDNFTKKKHVDIYRGSLIINGIEENYKGGMPIVFGDGKTIFMEVGIYYVSDPNIYLTRPSFFDGEILYTIFHLDIRECLRMAASCYNADDMKIDRFRYEFITLVKYMFEKGIVKFQKYGDGNNLKSRVYDMNSIEKPLCYKQYGFKAIISSLDFIK